MQPKFTTVTDYRQHSDESNNRSLFAVMVVKNLPLSLYQLASAT